MITHIGEFCALLRVNGVRVSTAEVLDAVAAAEVVGIDDGASLRAALASTLIKRPGDRSLFVELFELYFRRGARLLDQAAAVPAVAMLREAGIGEAAVRALVGQVAGEAAGLSAMARMGMGMRTPEVAALIRGAGFAAELEAISSPLQVGHYTYRLLDQLDVHGAEGEILAALDRLVSAGTLAAADKEALAAIARRNLERLRAAVREFVDEEFKRRNLDYAEQMALRALAEKPLTNLTAEEVAKLRHEVARLARILRARVSLKPRLRKSGRLDLRRTLRRSLATGGVPFAIKWRQRQRRKPRLIVLCDISDSVRNVSRFMLQFVYTLQELFDRVYSFAFVAELGELTELFRRHDLERAMALAYSGAAVNVFANSNYGNVLASFAERHLDKVTARTTVMIIGDGRNNYNPTHAAILADIRRRAKQLLWLNPESPAAWGFGDSAMREYQPHCDKVVVVYNLDSLRLVVDELVM